MSTFMNPNESKTSKNPNQVRFFDKKDFDQKACSKQWDRVKIVCSQPFNKHVPFGLCFIQVHGERDPESERRKGLPLRKEEETISVGSFFKMKKESAEEKPLSGKFHLVQVSTDKLLFYNDIIVIYRLFFYLFLLKMIRNQT